MICLRRVCTQIVSGADNRQIVFELVRRLGPGAELLEPRSSRRALRSQLLAIADRYSSGGDS
jgi:hypothetical protein